MNGTGSPMTRVTSSSTPSKSTSLGAVTATLTSRIVGGRSVPTDSRMVSVVERFALRALGVACLLALVSVVANYSALTAPTLGAEEESFVDDPVAALLDA